MIQQKKQSLLLHVTACALILLLPIIDAPTPTPTEILLFDNPYIETDFVLHFLCLGFGYLNYFVFIPRFFQNPLKVFYGILVLVCLALISFVPWLISGLTMPTIFEEHSNIHYIIQIRHIFFLFAAIFLFSFMTWSEHRRRVVEQAVAVADLRYLKAQINPHFLFNSLNSIYVQLYTNPESAGKSLVKMSNIMRYIMQSSENQYENLNLAVSYLEDFLSLQQDRFQETVVVRFYKEIPDNTFQIAPLLLIPFVENAFKYGINPAESSEISIDLRLIDNELFFKVANHDYSKDIIVSNSNSIGIDNTQKRLELLYPDRHSLSFKKYGGVFLVELRIKLSK